MKNTLLELDTLPGVAKIVCLEDVESTQAVGRELALEGAAEKTLILAETQTAGKGRLGREWESAKGGLYMTLLLKPETGVKFLPHLSVLSGEAVAETLTEVYGIKTRIKKPNDVYAWHPRRRKWLKISGILTESSSVNQDASWLLLGVGVNLNNTPKLDTAVSVKSITGKEVCREEFLEAFFGNFWVEYSAWEYGSQAKS
ncbi:MAG TPA: biotin--[acetyl-CoA-carboxylase] ligase [Elusimicrobia bacterium]|nr:MAG: biotin--[acetyl-CoA-carboxylase] ligase [Elusimicrobia bacterium GWA2_64_40]OGR66756.1 MAG: biotin--[acetyl-CoA-carboxylase] ligase [Elusimicrobia bacterium GWB2_63_16]HAU88837.1 biotin--[acetyl-CoA-carboxylase] ligase [Elusimicrobiota bacterium]